MNPTMILVIGVLAGHGEAPKAALAMPFTGELSLAPLFLKLDVAGAKCELKWDFGKENWNIHRKAVRAVLKKWMLLEEWEEIPKEVRVVNRSE